MQPQQKPMKKSKLTKGERNQLFRDIDNIDFIVFNREEIKSKIVKAYNLRDEAHTKMLQADVLLDEVLRELNGDAIIKGKTKKK